MRSPLTLALALALVGTPAALAHGGGGGGDRPHPRGPEAVADERPPTPPPPQRRAGHARAHHLAQACVVADATADGAEVRVLGANRHLRRALAGERTFTVRLDASTDIRLVGRARRTEDGARRPAAGTHADLVAGVRVTVHIRAPRGAVAADLPAAQRVISHGAVRRCAVPVAPPRTDGGTDGGTGDGGLPPAP